MKNFDGISFLWALLLLCLIGAAYAVQAYVGFRNVLRDAEEDYDYKQERSMLDGRLSRDSYVKVFKRLHSPRKPAYIATTIFAIIVLTWPIFALLSVLLEQLYQLTGQNRVFEPGFLVWQFCIFFGVIISWTSIAYFMARRYHLYAPGTANYETEQQLIEDETGYRDKPVIENDWGIPPFIAIIGFVTFVIFIIYWKFFARI